MSGIHVQRRTYRMMYQTQCQVQCKLICQKKNVLSLCSVKAKFKIFAQKKKRQKNLENKMYLSLLTKKLSYFMTKNSISIDYLAKDYQRGMGDT